MKTWENILRSAFVAGFNYAQDEPVTNQDNTFGVGEWEDTDGERAFQEWREWYSRTHSDANREAGRSEYLSMREETRSGNSLVVGP